jgi:hypothetical protein
MEIKNSIIHTSQQIVLAQPNKKYEMSRACSTFGGDEKCGLNRSRKIEGERPSGRPRRRWEDNDKLGRFEFLQP